MFDSLVIRNFREFQNLKISPLQRINLLTGENNVGKTNVLEAIFLLFAEDQLQRFPTVFRSAQIEQNSVEEFMAWLFFQKRYDQRIQITALKGSVEEFSLTIDCAPRMDGQALAASPPAPSMAALQDRNFYLTYKHRKTMYRQYQMRSLAEGYGSSIAGTRPESLPRVAIFSTAPSDPAQDAIKYNKIVLKAGGEERMEDLLRIAEPRLRKLRSLQVGGKPLLYADIGLGHLIPVTQMGQGFNRLLTIYSEMLVSEAKVLLVDEVENGLHYAALKSVWEGLAEAARKAEIQVFATTHSWGCIVAGHQALSESAQYDFAVHRIQRTDGNVEAITYDREMLEASLETELEVR